MKPITLKAIFIEKFILVRLLFSCTLMLLTACDTREGEQLPPNVIVFLVDDLGWSDLGCYGSDLHETPNIDRLANMGVKFTNAYSACTVCSPTRAAIMTAKYPARLNITDWIAGSINEYGKVKVPDWQKFLPLEEETIAEYLKNKGYQTAHVGKWHLGEDSIYYPQYQGFDVNIAGYSKGSPPSYFYPYVRPGREPIPYLEGGEAGEYLTDRLTEEALTFIKQNQKEPFFLNFDHYSVHTPIQGKDSLTAYYEEKVQQDFIHNNPEYAAMVSSTDQSLGRIVDALDSMDILDNTIIFFTSDNGGLILWDITSNAPLRSGKGSPYEGGTRVPMIVKPAGTFEGGTEVDEPVISMDIFATVRDLFKDNEVEEGYHDGQSILPLLEQREESLSRDALYWHYPHHHEGGSHPHSSIREGDYKLIEFHEDGHLALYHLTDDIGETNDLSSEMPERTQAMYQKLQKWKEEVQAQMPLPNPDYDSIRAKEYYPTW
ncbi:arylsulfatase A [Catalinimonas alkaloidigena]|uniref:sulfatase n=1 Tax=Catalinimonas alkaloidigena TaxID=1075417 RepID=UPI002407546D|nr:sulfatase [Catalinimonas alkaloidigena]MDF9796866.1 arylsulfatase A [Catalinimonas alkaloidigena]